jgi:ubiquitin C-terminal hydrolase
MDNLHEDLNTVLKKPYIEVEDFDPKKITLQEHAAKCKVNYTKRENSCMTKLFYGHYLSKITCPDCGNVSITLDPFNMISLPLNAQRDFSIYMMDEADVFKLIKI